MILKKIGGFGILLFIVLGVIYFFLPNYAQKAFLHLTADIDDYKIFENRTIAASNPKTWGESTLYNQYEMGQTYKEELERYETTAFLIVKDTALYYEKYFLGYNENEISNSFSAAKSIVSLLIGIAIEEGKIKSVFQPVGDFVESFREGEKSKILIKDVLTMSSGIRWDEAYLSPFSKTTNAYYGDDLKKLISELEVDNNPAEEFAYKSINTQVLAEVLESATGQSISDYATNRLWRKIGAETDALWSLDKEGGMEKAFCCFNSTARDFARIGQLVLNKGKWDEEQVVPSEYIEMATQPAQLMNAKETVPHYGYQWWILDYKGRQIPYARGILGQYIFVLEDKTAVVVRLGKSRSKFYTDQHPNDVYTYVEVAYELLK
ncbi:serine hydrolase domain-containing protein [Marivirga harenae]|uniref:serine hydrolase domain-containing protein n=1 Tax=Marivirga harenae TaxID=2010992 RepID=UPI0026E07D96|nr:serine hydrolase [Marivirga harenae]WKV13153.1 serine hydrolase [Marivirga harenae]